MLITGRVVYHFHTRTKTGRSAALNERAPHPYVEIHPADALGLGIGLGDLVEITSPNGRWEGVAMVVDTVRPGEVFVPFHYGHGAQSANQHTWYARDPVSHQPQLKSCCRPAAQLRAARAVAPGAACGTERRVSGAVRRP
ncbi:MAG: molybdopterin dinucleotide binding domain-containing protein [Acetobacteraceae bacterium]